MSDLAPSFIKLFYTSGGLSHEQTIPCRIDGTPTIGVEPTLNTVSGGTILASTGIAALITVLKPLLPPTASWTGYEIYKKIVGADPTFVYGNDLAIIGTSGAAVLLNSQMVITFRSSVGGTGRVQLMDCGLAAVNTRVPARVSAAAPIGAIMTYLLGTSSILWCRDDGYPVSGMYATTKTNDALRKRRLLDS